MKNSLIFAKRNIKELFRNPISWIFGILMPVGILVLMQIIVKSIGADIINTQTPMFAISNFVGGVILFSSSFLSLFISLMISQDRSKSFLSRLYTSPLTSIDFILGYIISVFPFAIIHGALTFIFAVIFGLELTINIIPAFLFSLVFALLFILLGVIIGSLLNEKGAPPISSIVVQLASLLSGMWFNLEAIGGGLEVFCKILPFANCYDIIKYTLLGEYSKMLIPLLIVLAYILVFSVLAIVLFKKSKKKAK